MPQESSFDPYHKWFGIPPQHQPPNHYRLLGLEKFESDREVIQAAAEQRMAHLQNYKIGPQSELSQRLLNEVARAKVCLLNPSSKFAYDEELRGGTDDAQTSSAQVNPLRRNVEPAQVVVNSAEPAPAGGENRREYLAPVVEPPLFSPRTSAQRHAKSSPRKRTQFPTLFVIFAGIGAFSIAAVIITRSDLRDHKAVSVRESEAAKPTPKFEPLKPEPGPAKPTSRANPNHPNPNHRNPNDPYRNPIWNANRPNPSRNRPNLNDSNLNPIRNANRPNPSRNHPNQDNSLISSCPPAKRLHQRCFG